MEISQFGGFSGMGYPSDQWPFVEMNMEDAVFIDNTHHLYGHSPPVMEFKTSSWNSCITSDQSVNRHYASATNQPTRMNPKANNTPQHEHILAERKRREKLSQRFIALSALVPGLKKMDKASVLGDAIKYLKTLKEKVKTLEEEAKKESNTDQSVVFVKKYHEGGEISVDEQLPEVEARYSGKDILIRLHCEKKPGVVEQTLDQIRKLHLTVINITVMTFASYALDITVVAQMDQEFTMKAKDLVENLRTSLM